MRTGQRRNGAGRGFVLAELVAIAAVLLVVASLFAVGGRQNRLGAGLAGSLANLKKIGEVGASYAADYDDQSWSFTWSPGNCPSQYPDLRYADHPGLAFIYQAVDIARRLSGRDDLPRVDNRLRVVFLSTLVLADYLGEPLPAEWMVSPGDKHRVEWQQDPDNPPDFGDQGGDAWERLFAPYGSSYGLMPAFWAPDQRDDGGQTTVYQYASDHALIWWPNSVVVGERRMAEVAFPAQKVRVAERESYFFGTRPTFYLHPASRVPLLMADGAAGARTTADANASFRPNSPDDHSAVTTLDYLPNPVFEAPPLTGSYNDEDLDGAYQWTRRGLRGIDFNGERVK